MAALPEQNAVFAPATTYKYSNLGMALLGEIVTAVSGEPWAEYLQKNVLRPLGMASSSAAPRLHLSDRAAVIVR
ncbi:MAG: serine hydrolase domain-containing protein [Thermoanaerobaculia bacterium]